MYHIFFIHSPVDGHLGTAGTNTTLSSSYKHRGACMFLNVQFYPDICPSFYQPPETCLFLSLVFIVLDFVLFVTCVYIHNTRSCVCIPNDILMYHVCFSTPELYVNVTHLIHVLLCDLLMELLWLHVLFPLMCMDSCGSSFSPT